MSNCECKTYIDNQKESVEKLQSELEMAEETLRSISKNSCCDKCQEAKRWADKYFSDKEKKNKRLFPR